ncbi:hypothetical protein JOY44_11365 [Phormidium sp. CLA17]|nr:hypothetical protein [Leptolyngbya sp. Cla-17]MBM0742212.1 hypothetical protein [Leptolyngbya sp. Cla-17]
MSDLNRDRQQRVRSWQVRSAELKRYNPVPRTSYPALRTQRCGKVFPSS